MDVYPARFATDRPRFPSTTRTTIEGLRQESEARERARPIFTDETGMRRIDRGANADRPRKVCWRMGKVSTQRVAGDTRSGGCTLCMGILG